MRPLNVLHDLPAVADLIEICFSETMDPEGRSYLEQMRRSGHDSTFLRWAPKVIDTVSLPLSGFVWEDSSRIVGNVSLIPFRKNGRHYYLIANVATHPDYRRKGIARMLTVTAVQRACEKHADSLWLHVRDDNPGAIHLYQELGFVERTRRTNWYATSGTTPFGGIQPTRVDISSRTGHDWELQSKWLSRAYPEELSWYIQRPLDLLNPSLLSGLYRFFSDTNIMQWSAYQDALLRGVLAAQHAFGRPEQLWAAFPPNPDQEAVTALLLHARRLFSRSRGLVLEYPTGPADEAIRAAGFTPRRTLLWMERSGETL